MFFHLQVFPFTAFGKEISAFINVPADATVGATAKLGLEARFGYNQESPGCLGFIGDDILPSYIGIIQKTHDKDPYATSGLKLAPREPGKQKSSVFLRCVWKIPQNRLLVIQYFKKAIELSHRDTQGFHSGSLPGKWLP